MTKWHPATKLLLIAGALAVPYLLWTQPEDEPVAAVSLKSHEPSPLSRLMVEHIRAIARTE